MMKKLLAAALCVVSLVSGASALVNIPTDVTLFSEKNGGVEVSVVRQSDGSYTRLIANGRILAWSEDGSGRRAFFPMILSGHVDETLIMGVGTGAAARAALTSGAKKVDIVETLPNSVKIATDFFPADNEGALKDKKVSVLTSLPAGSKTGYDVIIAGLSGQGIAGNAPEFTTERFAETRGLLKPDGVFAQWIALDRYSSDDIKIIVATFRSVFPHMSVWAGDINPVQSWALLLGSAKKPEMDFDGVGKRLAVIEKTGDMGEGANTYSFLTFHINDADGIQKITDGVPVHTMAKPAFKDTKSITEPMKQSVDNFMFWMSYRAPVTGYIKVADPVREKLTAYARARDKIISGRKTGVAGNAAEETAWYDKARQDAPEEPHIAMSYLALGRAFYSSGILDRAASLLEKARDVAPNKPLIRYYLGKTYEKMMRYPQAQAEYGKLRQLAPGYVERIFIEPPADKNR